MRAGQQLALNVSAASAAGGNSARACQSGSRARVGKHRATRPQQRRHFLDELLHLPADRLAVVLEADDDDPGRRRDQPARSPARAGAALRSSRHTGRVRERCSVSSSGSTASVAAAKMSSACSSGRGFSLSVTCVMMPSVPSAADVQLAQVVAGHVLDDPAARLDLLPLVVDDADADDVVAEACRSRSRGPLALAARAPPRVARSARHVDGQRAGSRRRAMLAGARGDAGLDRDGHVAGGVVDDLVQPRRC